MARPTKQGIDYFPMDVQFDEKVELFIAETGGEGLGVLVTIWQLIYQNNGYYIDGGNDLYLLIRRRLMTDLNRIGEIVEVALRREIFNSQMHSKYGILTSKATQKRYFIGSKKKKAVVVNENYLLEGVFVGDNSVNVDGNATNVNVKEEVNTKYSVDDKKAAEFIFEKIKILNPKTKPPSIELWSEKIRQLREIDRRSHREICELFQWANQDSFWQSNILSPGKLREKWDQLAIKRNQEKNCEVSGGFDSRSKSKRVSDKLDEIARKDIQENGFAETLDSQPL